MGLGREKKVYLRGEMPALFGKSSLTAQQERRSKRIWPKVLASAFAAVAILDSYVWPDKPEDPSVPRVIHAWDMNTKAWKHSGGNPLRYIGFKYTAFGREKLDTKVLLAQKEEETSIPTMPSPPDQT